VEGSNPYGLLPEILFAKIYEEWLKISKGPGRIDLFCGFGEAAESMAANLKE
jgi:hypothetical protein